MGRLVSLFIVLATVGLAAYLLIHGESFPRTDDAYVQARYIAVSAEVPGRIVELFVRDDSAVEAGELMFQIDPESYQLAVEEIFAQVTVLEAQLKEAERRRAAAVEMAEVAKANTQRVREQEALAKMTYERLLPLSEQNYVSRERIDEALSVWKQAESAVLMARSNELAAELAIPSLETIEAELKAVRIQLAQAKLELERTQVKAPFSGRVVNCDIAPGMMVMPGEPVFTLVDTREWFVVANYREGDLRRIRVGDRARVRLMTDPDRIYDGEVISLGHAIQTQDAYDFGPLPTVRNQLNWVRLAQRFPVWIRIHDPKPEEPFRVGASAVVTVESSQAKQ